MWKIFKFAGRWWNISISITKWSLYINIIVTQGQQTMLGSLRGSYRGREIGSLLKWLKSKIWRP